MIKTNTGVYQYHTVSHLDPHVPLTKEEPATQSHRWRGGGEGVSVDHFTKFLSVGESRARRAHPTPRLCGEACLKYRVPSRTRENCFPRFGGGGNGKNNSSAPGRRHFKTVTALEKRIKRSLHRHSLGWIYRVRY